MKPTLEKLSSDKFAVYSRYGFAYILPYTLKVWNVVWIIEVLRDKEQLDL